VVPWRRVRPTEPPFAVASGKRERRMSSERDWPGAMGWERGRKAQALGKFSPLAKRPQARPFEATGVMLGLSFSSAR